MRGFLILCVVVGHTPLGYLTASDPKLFGLPLYYFSVQVIWFFALPLFIAISCLYIQPLSLAYSAKRALAILVPYVLYLVLQQWPALTQNPLGWLRMAAWGNFSSLQSIIWFLPALYLCNIAAAAIVKHEGSVGFGLALSGVALLSIATAPWVASVRDLLPFGINLALMMLPFVFVLRLVERRREVLSYISRRACLIFTVGAAGCLFVLEPEKLTNPWRNKIDLAQYSIPSTPVNYLLWMMVALGVFLFFRFRPISFLRFLGIYSMPIYLLHYEVIKLALEYKLPEKIGAGFGQAASVIACAIFFPALIGVGARRLSPRLKFVGL